MHQFIKLVKLCQGYPLQRWEMESFDGRFINGIYPGKKGPYVVIHGMGIFQFNDILQQWLPVFKSLPDHVLYTLTESKEGSIWAGCDSGLYRSADGGKTWALSLDHNNIHRLIIEDQAIICGNNYGVWRSINTGETWERIWIDEGRPTMLLNTSDGIMAVFERESFAGCAIPQLFYKSTDSGATWTKMYERTPDLLSRVGHIVQAGRDLFAYTAKGIIRSTDMGQNWHVIMPAPEDPGHFYNLISSGQSLVVLRGQGC
jgi:photosystem II stability/assembly factor-like uncharacterized protein